jgi:hypothetical protein
MLSLHSYFTVLLKHVVSCIIVNICCNYVITWCVDWEPETTTRRTSSISFKRFMDDSSLRSIKKGLLSNVRLNLLINIFPQSLQTEIVYMLSPSCVPQFPPISFIELITLTVVMTTKILKLSMKCTLFCCFSFVGSNVLLSSLFSNTCTLALCSSLKVNFRLNWAQKQRKNLNPRSEVTHFWGDGSKEHHTQATK